MSSTELSPAKRALLDARLKGLHRLPGIVRSEDAGTAPPSFAQERFWFLERLGQGGDAYHSCVPLRLTGLLDASALEQAIGEIVRRHDALRTSFREADGILAQVIAPFDGFVLAVEDLDAAKDGASATGAAASGEVAAGDAARDEVGRQRVLAEMTRPFDLQAGPLFRALLVRLAPARHLLSLAMHHIITDGWSWTVFFRELWTLYHAYREGVVSPLPALRVQYADYARWQRQQAGGPEEARQLAYWRAQLGGAPALLLLPTDRPRPPVPSFRGGTVPVRVPRDVLERVRQLGRIEAATPFMVVLAAFQVLLARYIDGGDVVVGTLAAGRTRPELQDLIGLFMNTLVLRTRISNALTFRQALARVRETVLGAYEHQDLPFVRLVEALQPERSLSHSSLFQVLFQLEDGDVAGVGLDLAKGDIAKSDVAKSLPGLRVEYMNTPRETSKFDLTLDLRTHAQGIGGPLEYSTDLFEHRTAMRMVDHFVQVLTQVTEDPDRRLSDLSLVGAAERDQLVRVWNETTAPRVEGCIHELFDAQVARTPDAVALIVGDAAMSYAQLDARANELASHLERLGVGPEVRVGVCLARGFDLLVALLGVLKAGGAYVPMDPGFPAERIAYMLGDSGATVLLTQRSLLPILPTVDGVTVCCLDAAWPEIADEAASEVADEREGGRRASPAYGGSRAHAAVHPDHLCYVIYTSGSTGRPKGVAMHHRGVVNYLVWGIEAYGAALGAGAPVFTSLAVDLTITNLLPLFAGRPVHVLPEEQPVEALASLLRRRPGFGLMKITPIHLSVLTPLLTAEEARAAALSLVIGADFLSADTTVFWQDEAPKVRLLNEYGPTETVVGCSAYTLPAGVHRQGPVPVGGPIQHLRFYVLDAQQRPVPAGLPGELYIGGVGVARGYLGRPGLSAEKFVPDPFEPLAFDGKTPGARMYRTGDRARWFAEGILLILGRTDHQVKVRGYRVELGEIESALRRHDGVTECLVALREDRPGDPRLVAYVVGTARPAALREHLQRSLPAYMVPSAFVVLDALPETATGKLNRQALPPPTQEHDEALFEAPATYLEVQLLQLWEELLGAPSLSCTQNFFEVGGNSLLALRLFAEIRRRLHCDLSLTTLFTGATVRQMAAAIALQRRSASAPAGSVIPLQPHGTRPPLFCVHPAGRTVHRYINIVRHLGADQPVYGVRDVGDLARPMAQIAAEHVEAIRAVQPRGPYSLLGWSFGGTVVYEMASQLEQLGEPVAFVGVMDTAEPLVGAQLPRGDDAHLLATLAGEVAEDMGRPFSIRLADVRGQALDDQVRTLVEALHAQGAAPRGYDAAALRQSYDMIHARDRCRIGYLPGPFSGSITLFRPSEAKHIPEEFGAFVASWTEEERETFCWCRLVPNRVRVHWIPGSHVTMGTEPNVRVLAQRVREGLAAGLGVSAEA